MVTVRLNATYFPAVEMMSGVALAVIVLYGGYQAINGSITVGTIVAFVATLSFLFEPIQQLSQLYTTYQSGMAALEKIFGLLDVEPSLQDATDARPTRADPRRDQLRGRLLQLRAPRGPAAEAGVRWPRRGGQRQQRERRTAPVEPSRRSRSSTST